MRVLMRAVLESRDVTSRRASDGVQAIEMCRNERPSMVLLDMRMRKMNRIETLRELKRFDSDLPIIIITAQEDSNDRKKNNEYCLDGPKTVISAYSQGWLDRRTSGQAANEEQDRRGIAQGQPVKLTKSQQKLYRRQRNQAG